MGLQSAAEESEEHLGKKHLENSHNELTNGTEKNQLC